MKQKIECYNGIPAIFGYNKLVKDYEKNLDFFGRICKYIPYELNETFLSYGIEFYPNNENLFQTNSDIPFIWDKFGAELFHNKEKIPLNKVLRSKVSKERMKILMSMVRDESCAILTPDGHFASDKYLCELLGVDIKTLDKFIEDMGSKDLIKILHSYFSDNKDGSFYIINPMILDNIEIVQVQVYFSFVDTLHHFTDRITRDKYRKIYPMYLVYIDTSMVDLYYQPDYKYKPLLNAEDFIQI